MSAQLLICKFAVFTCVSFFLLMHRGVMMTRMAHWLTVCQDPFSACRSVLQNNVLTRKN